MVSVTVCVCVHILIGKRLELSTTNLAHIYFMAVAHHALTWRSKGHGQGHTVMKIVKVTWLLVKCAAAAEMGCCFAAGVGLHLV